MNFADAPIVQQTACRSVVLDFSTAPYSQSPPPSHGFEDIAERLRLCAQEVCAHLLPGGRIQSGEYCIGDIAGNKGKSLKISLGTGRWSDFAGSDSGGDLIALWAAVHGISQGDARDEAAAWLGLDGTVGPAAPRQVRATSMRSASRGGDDSKWWRGINPTGEWTYTDAAGNPIVTVKRYDRTHDGEHEKTYRPWSHALRAFKAPPSNRPLYRLPELLARTSEPVVIAEGEKAAEALRECGFLATCIMSGARAADKSDWTPLRGRHLILWPDRDEAGEKFAAAVEKWAGAVGAASLRCVAVPDGPPDGFDAADATPDERRELIEAALASPISRLAVLATSNGSSVGSGAPAPHGPSLIAARKETQTPYPVDSLPEIIRAAVVDYQAYGQQPVSLIATVAIGASALAVQGLADVARDERLIGPSSLNVLIVAQSGERKTAADREFFAGVRAWEQEQAKAVAEERQAYDQDRTAYESQIQGVQAALKKAEQDPAAQSDLERLTARHKELSAGAPKPPRQRRLIYEDATEEAIAKGLADNWPTAALVTDEAAIFFGGHSMQQERALRTLAVLNQCWDGKPIVRDRSTVASLSAYGRRLSACLVMQPNVAQELIKGGNSQARGIGFLARSLITYPASTMGDRLYRAPERVESVEAFNTRIRELLNLPLNMDDAGVLRPAVLRLSPEALVAWIDYHDSVERELRAGGRYENVRDFASKSAEQAARIAAIFHVLECGPVGSITEQTMARAIVVVRWYLDETNRVFGNLAVPEEVANAEALADWLSERGGEARASEILQFGPNRLRSAKSRDGAIAVLRDMQRARCEMRHGASWVILTAASTGGDVGAGSH